MTAMTVRVTIEVMPGCIISMLKTRNMIAPGAILLPDRRGGLEIKLYLSPDFSWAEVVVYASSEMMKFFLFPVLQGR